MDATTRYRVDDRGYIDRRVDAVDSSMLAGPVRSALRDPAARVTGWRQERIAYDFLNPSSGGIYRFAGTAETAGGPAEWGLILKVTRSAESLDHPVRLPPDVAHSMRDAIRWDRELLAYESGFLSDLAGELVAAASHGGVRNEDDTGWIWLEDVGTGEDGAWSLAQWAFVGRVLGTFNGGYLATGRAPDHDWLGRNWLRVWVTQITPFSFGSSIRSGAVWEEPLVRDAYPPALRDRLRTLWADRDVLLRSVEALPRTCSHLDSHRRNLFLRATGNGDQVVAIDWGLLGLAPPGEEIASTLVGTIASGEAPVDDAAELSSTLYAGYLSGLRQAGWRGDERSVRLAYAAAAALRAFSVLRLDVAEDPQRTDDEARAILERSSAFAMLLLELGDEARTLA